MILKQKGATAWVDGQNLLGPVVGNYCAELSIKLAKEHGVGWVVCKGSNHYGICGYYALKMAAEGVIVSLSRNNQPNHLNIRGDVFHEHLSLCVSYSFK